MDALRRVLGAGSDLGIFAILVDAKNDQVSAFCQGYGFQPFPSRPDRLFLLMATAAAAIEQM